MDISFLLIIFAFSTLPQLERVSSSDCQEDEISVSNIACTIGTEETDCITDPTQGNFTNIPLCVEILGAFKCACSTLNGYGKSASTGKCDIQIDECTCGTDGCHHICEDKDPAVDGILFQCSCNEGYEIVNQFNCSDMDECTDNPDICGVEDSSTCANTEGSYVCTCNTGWEINNNFCEDVNECDTSPCQTTCTNNVGSYECSCDPGYELQPDDSTCEDLDECAQGVDECDQTCANTVGSYTCSCSALYYLGNDGTSCLLQNCPQNETCELDFSVRIAIEEYWISQLYDPESKTYQHAATSLQQQFEQGFALNNMSWTLTRYELVEFDLKTSRQYYAYLNISIEDVNATLGGRTDQFIEEQIIFGLNTLDLTTFTNPINVVFDSFEITQLEPENTLFILDCLDAGMHIRIHQSEFQEGVGANNLTLADETCTFSQTGEYWQVTFNYPHCGVTREEFSSNGTIRYTQFVLFGDTARTLFNSGSNLAFVSARSHLYTLECNYRISEAFGNPLEFFDAEVVEDVGSFNVSLLLYEETDFNQVVTVYPWYMKSDTTHLAFEARLDTGDDQLGIYLEECFATPSDDIYGPDKVTLMTNGCAQDPDFEWVAQVMANQAVRFTFVPHKFINLSRGGEALEETFYFCYYEICDQTEAACNQKLSNWFTGCSGARARRNAEDTRGPSGLIGIHVIYLIDTNNTQTLSQDEDEMLVSEVTVALIFVAVMFLCCGSITALLVILRYQNAKFARYFENTFTHQHNRQHSDWSQSNEGFQNDFSMTPDIPRLKHPNYGY